MRFRLISPNLTKIMTQDQATQLLEKIQAEIAAVQEQIARLEELTKPISPDNAIGRVSRMDAINNRSVNEAGLRQARSKLTKLQRQLERHASGDLGRCTKCGEPIRFERLMFLPESSWCVSCARKYK
jgi:DnaK suppressor protein